MKKSFAFLLLYLLVHSVSAQQSYHEITLPELMKKYQQDKSNMVIVDVRSDGEYYDSASRFKSGNIGRIKGVQHIDVSELMKGPENLKPLEQFKDREVYLICSHSYRSRSASNILLKNGFKNVNNVQGGMTEWYRRYEDLAPYRNALETSVRYTNISAAQLFNLYQKNSEFQLVGINIIPRYFYDSASKRLLEILPSFKKAIFFNSNDSGKVLEYAKKIGGKPIVLFSGYSYGAAEMADWLVSEGIPNVQYLVGGINYYLEYIANKNLMAEAASSLVTKNTMRFISSGYFCDQMANKYRTVIIDLRNDTLFNRINEGIKSDYTHLQNSVSFPADRSSGEFEKTFPDKAPQYIMVSRYGSEGIELADELSKKGYHINWLLGGIARFDWYTINVETFHCSDLLLRPASQK
jgi:rhodanese-related sulfurtransferase